MEPAPDPGPAFARERIDLGAVVVELVRPADPEALLDEAAFGDEEFIPYWAELWPSCEALTALLAERGVAGERVLELGCGLGVPSIAAARLGAAVTATDWAADALVLLAENAEQNGVAVELRRLDWFAPDDAWPGGPPPRWPLVVAADVLYEARNGPALLATLDRVVADGGEAWIADPGRRAAMTFWRTAAEAGWAVSKLGAPAPGQPIVRRLRRG